MRRLTLATLALLAGTGGGWAQATCPTAADLDGGIALIRLDPFYSNVMTATPDGLAEARLMTRDGVPETVSSTYSHALTVTGRVGGNGTLALDYADDTAILDELPRVGSWTTAVTLSADGQVQNTGTFTARFLGEIIFELGPCTFEAWHIRTALALAGRDPIMMDHYYAPAIGLSLASVTLDAQGNAVSGVVYDRIEAR